jgi:hypothetical protein
MGVRLCLSLSLREEYRLCVTENSVLRNIFRLMWDKVTRDWIKLNNEKLQGFYSSPKNIRSVESRNMK